MTRPLRSGWLPAGLLVLLTLILAQRGSGVAWSDLLLFTGYLAGWLVLPGTLIWRAATRSRGPRPLAEDLALGALVGYVAEFPVYLVCLMLGHPRWYLLWPVVILLATLTSRPGRALWRRTRQPMPLRWSWGVSALVGYTVLWTAHRIWGPIPATGEALRSPYVDEPYHLALATSLKHFWPPRITYAADTDLQYHWLSHLHVAAASWVTGIEPIVLLRTLAIPALTLIVVVALAHAAVRLSGAAWTGLVAAGAVVVAPLTVPDWSSQAVDPFLSLRLLLSPSAGFVNAGLLLAVILCLELLNGRIRDRAAWVLVLVTLGSLVGAKSTALPTVLAGCAAAALVCSLAERRVHRVAVGLTVTAGVAFLVAKRFFVGPGNHDLGIDPFALTSSRGVLDKAESIGNAVFIVGLVSVGAGMLLMLVRGGWRRSDTIFLNALVISGVGAGVFFHQSSLSEYYFIYVILVPATLGGVLGLHRLVTRVAAEVPVAAVRTVLVGTFVAAAAAAAVLTAALPAKADIVPSDWSEVLVRTIAPIVVLLVLGVGVALAAVGLARGRVPGARLLFAPALVVALAGPGTVDVVRSVPGYFSDPLGRDSAAHYPVLIGPGGITAARWLRAHTDLDTVIATNAHCQYRPQAGPCTPRNFWMAGYAERQFLVEGWSYVFWEAAGRTTPEDYNPTSYRFWDQARLRANDEAFQQPTPAALSRLAEKYHVRYLLVDRRYPADKAGLRALADVRFRSGSYTVFELR